jgi:BirA family transcriptional regulator, biotin operon repressor / biotin---[acetyl-CoA-carboxylase] ligase
LIGTNLSLHKIIDVLGALRDKGWLQAGHCLPEVGSTNDWAREFATESPASLPALFVAQRQTLGRGRSHRLWWSPEGCLMLTLALPVTELPPDASQWNRLALLVGVSAARSVEDQFPGLEVKLKWPNDLYLGDRKLGGILIESFTLQPGSPVFLIGLGINISVNWLEAPEEVRQRATCVSTEITCPIEPAELLFSLIERLSRDIRDWRDGSSDWLGHWNRRCYLTGRLVTGQGKLLAGHQPSDTLTGRCEGIAEDGQLLVRLESGELQKISYGEVLPLSIYNG